MLINEFLKYLQIEKRYSEHTVLNYAVDLKQFSSFYLDQFELSDLKKTQMFHIRTWVAQMAEEGKSRTTINRKISSIRSFFKYLLKNEIMTVNPAEAIFSPKVASRAPKTIDLDNVNALIDKFHFGNSWEDLRDKAMISLLYETGMRRSELLGIQWEDLDLRNKQLKILGKGNKERIVFISEKMLILLSDLHIKIEDYFQKDPWDSKYVFLTNKGKQIYPKFIERILKKYLPLVTSSKQINPHSIRHSVATELLENGADLNMIKTLLGHANLSATQIYAKYSIDKMKDVYLKTHPKSI